MAENATYTPTGNSNYVYGQPNNAQYYGSGNYSNVSYWQGINNDQNDEEESNFNIMEWVMLFLHYWYLFVIGVAIAWGCAMLKNRKWLPSYYSQGTIIIKESGYYGGSNSALMQGFGVDAGYKNVNNQVIMLGSYDLMCRVVDSLPFMRTEYITQGRFKTRNLYHQSPILIETSHIESIAYSILFQIDFQSDGSFTITSTNEDVPMIAHGRFGEPLHTQLFDGLILPSDVSVSNGKMFFRFRTKESLVDEFMGRLQLSFVGEGSTVLAIALTSETPQRDCEFIDKLAEIYLLQNLEQKNEVADNSIRFINQQLITLQSSLEVSEGAMTQFRQENRFVDVGSYAGQLMSRISQYDQQNMSLKLKETYFDYLTNYLQTNIENGAVIAPTSLGLNEPILMTLVQQLNDLRIQRGELSEKNVYYAKYTKDIENVKTAINEVVSSMRASLEIEKQDLKDRFADVEEEIKNLPSKELQMVAIERNYRIDDNYYTFFLQKRAEAEIQKAGNTPDNKILDKARTTAVVNGKAKSKNTTTALIIGLLVPMALIILSELLKNKMCSAKGVKR
ncbi:MAG: GumC family protein, partial [Paludibacteraceae bacterium]